MMYTSVEILNKNNNIMCNLCNKMDHWKVYIISNELDSKITLCPECKKAFAIFLGYNMTMVTSSRELLLSDGRLMLYDNFII